MLRNWYLPIRMNFPMLSAKEAQHIIAFGNYSMDFVFIADLDAIKPILFWIRDD